MSYVEISCKRVAELAEIAFREVDKQIEILEKNLISEEKEKHEKSLLTRIFSLKTPSDQVLLETAYNDVYSVDVWEIDRLLNIRKRLLTLSKVADNADNIKLSIEDAAMLCSWAGV